MNKGGMFIVSPVDRGSVFSREHFSEEQNMFVEAVREFGRDRIFPVTGELDKFNGELTRKIFLEMGELGFLAVDFPEEYGGLALDKVTTNITAETLMTGGNASMLVTFSDHTGIGTLPLIWYGTKEQKKKYLPKLAAGEWMGSFALTEPDAGSDVLSAKATAKLNDAGTHYLLNGSKIYVTNGSWADICITFAQVDGDKYTAFILDKNCTGWVVGPEEHKMGIKGSSTCTFFFEDCAVPVENMLGKVGQGTAIALNVLYTGRYKLGSTTMGGSKYCIDLALNFANERQQFNRPISEFGMIRRKFAQMTVKSWEADTLCYMCAGSIDKAMESIQTEHPRYYEYLQKIIEDHGIEASLAKIAGSEAMAYNIDETVQIYGGAGFIEDYPVAGIYRDERINRIFEGTNEINRVIIGGTVLKKAILEELPIRDMITERGKTWIPEIDLEGHADVMDEALAVEFSRSLYLYTLNQLILTYGQDLKNEQWALEPLANMTLSLSIMDSGFKRYKNLPAGYKFSEPVKYIMKLSVANHFRDLTLAAEDLLILVQNENPGADHLKEYKSQLKKLKYQPDKINLQKTVTEFLYQHKHYFLD